MPGFGCRLFRFHPTLPSWPDFCREFFLKMRDKYLYIFVHVPKTGGETLIKHVVKNFPPESVLLLDNKNLKLYPHTKRKIDYFSKVKKYLLGLPLSKRRKIRFVAGYILPYGIEEFFPGKEARYITFIRHPLRRVLSMYNYYLRLYLNEDAKSKKKKLYRDILLINGTVPSFSSCSSWYKQKYAKGTLGPIGSSMYDFFKALGYTKGKSIKGMFDKFFFVGVTKDLDGEFLYLYKILDIKKFFIRQNVWKKQKKSLSQKEIRMVLRGNKVDLEIFEEALVKRDNMKAKDVSMVKTKRFLLLPFTQIIFDAKETLRRVKSWVT